MLIDQLILEEAYEKTVYTVGDFKIDVTLLETDDIAHIMIQFKDDVDAIENIIDYIIELPYLILLDIIYYIAKDKDAFNQLCETTTFDELLDSFSERVFVDKDKETAEIDS